MDHRCSTPVRRSYANPIPLDLSPVCSGPGLGVAATDSPVGASVFVGADSSSVLVDVTGMEVALQNIGLLRLRVRR